MAAPAGEVSHARPRRRGHRPVPLRGPPLVAGHDRMKGSINAAWNGAVKPSGPVKKHGDRVKNRRGGAPEGAPAEPSAGGAPSKGAPMFCAVPAPRLPQGRQRTTRAKTRKQDKTALTAAGH